MNILNEFKTFIRRGNVIDLAVGVIIGAAFTKIVSSLVADVLTPPIGLLAGGVHFEALKLRIGGTPEQPVTINVGSFLQAVFDFFIVAACVFALVKAVNVLKQPHEAPPEAPELTQTEKLLTEIRDLLKEQRASNSTA
jgi:large conductance mechanosensitive channel